MKMIHIYHGDGKGKTTASVGIAIRALGADKKVVFSQFLKIFYMLRRQPLSPPHHVANIFP